MMSLGFFVGQAGSGFVSSRLNHRGALILSALAVAIALLFFFFSHSFGPIVLLTIALGGAAGLHVPSALATITAIVSRQDWGKAIAVHQTAPSMGLILGPLLAVVLLDVVSWRVILTCLGGLSMVGAVAFIRFGRCGEFPGEAPSPAIVKTILVQRSFWCMVALFAMAIGGSVGVYTMLPLYLVSERGLDPGWSNTLVGISRVSGLFVTFAAGWVTDYVGEKRAISVALLAAGIATILLGVVRGSWLVVIVFLQPALAVCFFPAGFAALSRIVIPNLRSVTTSLSIPLAFLLGGGIFPAFIGYMGEVRTFGLGFGVVGCFMLLAPVLASFLILREKHEEGC
jgi:NNP family nitrate/nitrite transporter-like MFS transporter